MVWILEHQKRYEEAMTYCDKAIEINPNFFYTLSYKGKLLYDLGRFSEALVYYDKALKLSPDDRRALHFRNKIANKFEKLKKKPFPIKF